jgi:uncharacterized membrane protein
MPPTFFGDFIVSANLVAHLGLWYALVRIAAPGVLRASFVVLGIFALSLMTVNWAEMFFSLSYTHTILLVLHRLRSDFYLGDVEAHLRVVVLPAMAIAILVRARRAADASAARSEKTI